MKAIVQHGNALVWQDVPRLSPGAGEVLLRVRAAGVNRADLSQRAGQYPPPPGASEILGLEVAGEVAELGPGVAAVSVGDEVCTLLSGGGYAEVVAAPAALLMPIPPGWSMEEAAGLPEVFLTAHLNLFLVAQLRPGETVLVHGGASGVGTAAIQLAHEAGCRVFATAGTDEKVTACRALGATALNYREGDFLEVVREQAGGVDVVLDMVGQGYLAQNLELLNTGGRLVVIATLSGSRAELELRLLMSKRLSLYGSTLRSRPLDEKVQLKNSFQERFWGALAAGRIKPVIDGVFDIRDADAAHERMKQNLNIGKLVLRLP
jgi:putative PIG3 family NAD(P)H quinone oxidoreductase